MNETKTYRINIYMELEAENEEEALEKCVDIINDYGVFNYDIEEVE